MQSSSNNNGCLVAVQKDVFSLFFSWNTLDPEVGLDLMSSYLEFLVVDVSSRTFSNAKSKQRCPAANKIF